MFNADEGTISMNAGRQLRETPAASGGRDRLWRRFLPNLDRTISVQGLIAMIGAVIALFGVFRDFFFSPGVYIPVDQVQLALADVSCRQSDTDFPFATLLPTVTLVATAPGRKVNVSVDSAEIAIAGATQKYVIYSSQKDFAPANVAPSIAGQVALEKARADAKAVAEAKTGEAAKALAAAKDAANATGPVDVKLEKAALDAADAKRTAVIAYDAAANAAPLRPEKNRYGVVCSTSSDTGSTGTIPMPIKLSPGTLVSIPVDATADIAPFLEPQHAGLESGVNAITPASLPRGAQISMTLRMHVINGGFLAPVSGDDRIVLTCHARLGQVQFDNYLAYNVTSLEPVCVRV